MGKLTLKGAEESLSGVAAFIKTDVIAKTGKHLSEYTKGMEAYVKSNLWEPGLQKLEEGKRLLAEAWEKLGFKKTGSAVEGGSDVVKGVSGAGLNKKLMNELAESGVKYNVDDVVMITKTSDGKLLWLEKGDGSAGLKHIINSHATNFADRGITDIPKFLEETLKSTPTRMGSSSKGMFAEYIINGKKYTLAYGNNGFIVSFYPSGK